MIPYHVPKVPKELTYYQQLDQFKVGDEVYVREDAELHTKDFSSMMRETLGKKGIIVKVNKFNEEYYGIDDDDYYFNPNDLCVHVQIGGNVWLFSYRSLFNPKSQIPSYEPKKIIKEYKLFDLSPDEVNYKDKKLEISKNKLLLFKRIKKFY